MCAVTHSVARSPTHNSPPHSSVRTFKNQSLDHTHRPQFFFLSLSLPPFRILPLLLSLPHSTPYAFDSMTQADNGPIDAPDCERDVACSVVQVRAAFRRHDLHRERLAQLRHVVASHPQRDVLLGVAGVKGQSARSAREVLGRVCPGVGNDSPVHLTTTRSR